LSLLLVVLQDFYKGFKVRASRSGSGLLGLQDKSAELVTLDYIDWLSPKKAMSLGRRFQEVLEQAPGLLALT
jgi:hypothetical protein